MPKTNDQLERLVQDIGLKAVIQNLADYCLEQANKDDAEKQTIESWEADALTLEKTIPLIVNEKGDPDPTGEVQLFIDELLDEECSDEKHLSRRPVLEKRYKEPQIFAFVRDMLAAGLKDQILHYNGRNLYTGPAVTAELMSDVMSRTSVRCEWDQLGLGVIVYPKA